MKKVMLLLFVLSLASCALANIPATLDITNNTEDIIIGITLQSLSTVVATELWIKPGDSDTTLVLADTYEVLVFVKDASGEEGIYDYGDVTLFEGEYQKMSVQENE